MTRYGPPDDDPSDPSEAPTGQYNYGDDGQPDAGSTPWYRKSAALIGLGALAAILIALAIYGIVELTHGGSSTSPPTSSTTPSADSTTPTTTSYPSSETTTQPIAPAPTTMAPATTPPTSTSIDDGRRHRRHHDGGMP